MAQGEAAIPTPELRAEVKEKPLLDPTNDKTHQLLFDYNVYFQEQMTDTVLAIAKSIREATKGRKMVWLFYGYNFEFASVAKGPAASAHYNLRAVLDSPDIDTVCSPISYFDRQLGGGTACMLTAESVTLAGKMYIYEDDTRTHIAYNADSFAGGELVYDLDRIKMMLRRNTGQCAMRNFGTWWMDLGGIGWFADPQLWRVMRELEPLDRHFLEQPTPYRPESARPTLNISSMIYSTGRSNDRNCVWSSIPKRLIRCKRVGLSKRWLDPRCAGLTLMVWS